MLSKAERRRPKADRAKRLSIFFSKVGCFIGKILGLRQTIKRGENRGDTAGRRLSQKVGANQVTAEGGESLAARPGFAYVKYHATTYARK